MSRISEVREEKEKTGFIKSKGFFMLAILFIFILILSFFYGNGGIIEISRSNAKIEGLRKDISNLEKQRDALLRDIQELEKNPLTLEKKAREKLLLMKKNEKVVLIINNKKDALARGK
ncbi:MAG: FtsB family cell division protein [Candidatus Omnitrophota bacterium]